MRKSKRFVLVTGGAGYVGSHACVELINAGFNVVVVDNFVNSSRKAIARIEEICDSQVILFEGDIRDAQCLSGIFDKFPIYAVMHFAGLKAVNDSVHDPLHYYENNVLGTLTLLNIFKKYGCKRFIFSSSATVYGEASDMPVTEESALSAKNPYGESKIIVEKILRDLATAEDELSVVALRYFNPVGAHPSGSLGEDPNGRPSNLMPLLLQVASKTRECLEVYGDDYDTRDGTGIRDYIHVVDLAKAHVRALLASQEKKMGYVALNLGTGQGTSVFELIRTFESATKVSIPMTVVGRRIGDVPESYADCQRAFDILGWCPELGIEDMCRDAWHWRCSNPQGYGT